MIPYPFFCGKITCMRLISFKFLPLFLGVLALIALTDAPVAWAQTPAAPAPQAAPPAHFEAQARAANADTLVSGKTAIKLWAVQAATNMSPSFNLKARSFLDSTVGQGKIVCDAKSHDDVISAQCVNQQDKDLGLLMLQQGYVTVDRAAVYGTVFEDAYIQAEAQAQNRGIGVWAADSSGKGGNGFGDIMMACFGLILFLCAAIAFGVLSVVIMRGFQKVIDAQNQNVEMMSQERKLREKERGIVAIMLDSELKANKAKIEAYRAVYDEMLTSLKNPDRPPKYKKSGDIIQKQPALSRAVFDRNTDKLEMLGAHVSSELIHFYARVKSSAEYINLEPSTQLNEAIDILEKALKNAQRMNDLADKVLESFANSGIRSENYDQSF